MNFDNTIIIVADLGQLKAYRVVTKIGIDRQGSMQVSNPSVSGSEKKSINLELILDIDYISAHKHISDEMSDKTGRLDISTGEQHNMLLEKDRRGLKQINNDIKTIVDKEAPSSWCLAFPKETNKQLTEMLDANIKKKLVKNLTSDLTKINKGKLLSYFK